MSAALAIGQDTTRKSLQAWGAYLVRLHSEPTMGKRVTLESAATSIETLKTPGVTELDTTATLHSPTCRCSLCYGGGLSTSGASIGGATVVEVNLTGELSEEEQRVVDNLKERDAEVRRHEQAHLAVAGQHAMGGPSYTYQVGPDGRRYAIGGSVQIDLSPVPNDPEATLRKAQQLRQAALAPSSPSSTDRQVAVMASRMAMEALKDISDEQRSATTEKNGETGQSENDTSQHPNQDSVTEKAKTSGTNEVPQLGGGNQVPTATLAVDGGPQSKTSMPASAAFASAMTDSGLDIYV